MILVNYRLFVIKFKLLLEEFQNLRMSSLVILSTILITLALAFYSVGVWSERISKYLKFWHTVTFWIGLGFDISGTYTMHLIAKSPFNILEPHTLTGQIALWLMFIHTIWATCVIIQKDESIKNKFHKFSIVVWCIWLIPYFGGMYLGMK